MNFLKKTHKKDEQEDKNIFTIQPVDDDANNKFIDPKFEALNAPPGPAFTKDMPAEEGTKEQRELRKEELNK